MYFFSTAKSKMAVNILYNQVQSLIASADYNYQINKVQQARQEYVSALNTVNSIKSILLYFMYVF